MRRAALLALLLAAARPAAAFGRPSRVLQGKHGANTDTTLTLYPILDPEALCNDGSRSGYYYAPATNPAKADLWLVYLQGGQWCYSNATCLWRETTQPYLTSSMMWYRSETMGGIFDSDPKRSPWGGANLVYVPYCSSDAWVGNLGPEGGIGGYKPWYFKGQRIIEALFAQLATGVPVVNTTVLHFANHTHATSSTTTLHALTSASRLLFAGCSAGSRGAAFTLDYVQAMLPAGSPPVLGFFDSPLWIDEEPIPDAPVPIVPLENQTAAVYEAFNVSGRIPAACAQQYPGAEGWKCLYGQYRIPFTQTPYLMSASQFDRYQLPYNLGGANLTIGMPPYTGPRLAYADAFQLAVRAVAETLPTAQQPRSAVYSSACFKHCTSALAWGSFWGVRIGALSLKDYLGAWYFNSLNSSLYSTATAGAAALPAGMPDQLIEDCTGWGCGQCHKKEAPTLPAPVAAQATRRQQRHALPTAALGAALVVAALALVAVATGRRSPGGGRAAELTPLVGHRL